MDGTPGSSGGSSGGSSTSLALLDLSSSNNFDLPTPQPGTRLTTVGSVTGMTSRTEVPSNTPIIVFDSNGYYNPVRRVTIKNKVFLTSVNKIYFYVNEGGGGWGNAPFDTLSLQYNTTTNDPSSADWSTLYTIVGNFGYDGQDDVTSNLWTLREVIIPAAAKFYNGVYLRFKQNSHTTSDTYYTWAVTSIVATINEYDQSYSPSSFSVIDLINQDTVDLPTPKSGGRLTTVGSVGGMTAGTEVPSNTPIVVFGEANIYAGWYGSSRTITNRSKICLAGVEFIEFYVNRGGGGWGDTSYSNLLIQFSYTSSSSGFSTLGTISYGSYASNSWTLVSIPVPASAKYYSGVYLRYFTASHSAGSTYQTWAVTSAIGRSGSGLSDDTSTNSTYYPVVSTSTSSPNLKVSSTKLSYNPSTGTLTSTIVADVGGNLRKLPNNGKSANYTLVIGDVGELINITTGGVIVSTNAGFSAGDAISIYNNSASSQTISRSGVTMYLAGTSTNTDRILAQRGVCTVLCVGNNEFVISGAGLS